MVEQERVIQTAQKIRDDQPKKELPVTQAAPDKAKLFILAAAGVVLFYFYNRGGVDQTFLVMAGIAGLIFYALFQGQRNPNYYLSEEEAKAALFQALKYKQTNPYDGDYEILPEDKIRPLMASVLRHKDGKPWQWEIGFQITRNSLTNYYSARMDPVTGAIRGIVDRPAGFTGREGPDIKFVKDPTMESALRYHRMGGEQLRR